MARSRICDLTRGIRTYGMTGGLHRSCRTEITILSRILKKHAGGHIPRRAKREKGAVVVMNALSDILYSVLDPRIGGLS